MIFVVYLLNLIIIPIVQRIVQVTSQETKARNTNSKTKNEQKQAKTRSNKHRRTKSKQKRGKTKSNNQKSNTVRPTDAMDSMGVIMGGRRRREARNAVGGAGAGSCALQGEDARAVIGIPRGPGTSRGGGVGKGGGRRRRQDRGLSL